MQTALGTDVSENVHRRFSVYIFTIELLHSLAATKCNKMQLRVVAAFYLDLMAPDCKTRRHVETKETGEVQK